MANKQYLVKYVDVRPHDPGGYTMTNENINVHRDLVKNITFNRVGAICAGGEVGLGVYGQRCKELVLIDHGKNGLVNAYAKLLLLKALGPDKFKSVITSNKPLAVANVSKEVVTKIPTALLDGSFDFSLSLTNNLAVEAAWGKNNKLQHLSKIIPKITLVHGDIRDLSTMGKFDLIYGSNAIIDHRAHDSQIPSATALLPALKTGGHLVFTGYNEALQPGFKQVRILEDNGPWRYYLWQKT